MSALPFCCPRAICNPEIEVSQVNKSFLSFLTLLTLGSAFATTPSGSTIINQATVSADDADVFSNAVSTTITGVCLPDLTPDGDLSRPGQVFETLPGGKVVVPLTLQNLGNEAGTFTLNWMQVNPTWTPENVKFFRDVNGNGEQDSLDVEQTRHDLNANDALKLLMVFTVPKNASGNTYFNPTASCETGEKDDNNVFQVKLNTQSSMTLTKSITPEVVKPGEQATVRLTLKNTGNTYLKDVQIQDDLNQSTLQGLVFVKDSLKSLNSSPVVQEVNGVVTATLTELAPMEQAVLEFQVQATPTALAGPRENLATAKATSLNSVNLNVEARASMTIEAQYGVALGPVNDPEAPEGSETDRQSQEITLPDAEMCFEHTLLNTSNSEDDYTLTAQTPEGWNAVFLNLFRLPLVQPVRLKAREALNYWVCYEKTSNSLTGNVEFQLTATSAHGPINRTWDVVKLNLVASDAVLLNKSIKDARGQAPVFGPYLAGESFTYLLEYTNATGVDLHNVTVQDTLMTGLEFISASVQPGITSLPENQTALVWKLGTVKPGKNSILVTVKLKQELSDGALLRNTFSLTSDEVKNKLSNEVVVGVWSSGILFAKAALQDQVMIGDQLGWKLTATNRSPSGKVSQVKIVDDLPKGLAYLAGSTRVNGVAFKDPSVAGQRITWTGLPDMEAGAVLNITFQTRVLPEVSEKIQNTAEFTAVGMNSAQTTVIAMQSTAVATAKVVGGLARPLATLVGRVYLDINDNGTFEPETDRPVEKARVILAGGRMVLTDKMGRYSFDGLDSGVWAVRLDPNSVGYVPRATPQDGGQRGTQSMMLTGLGTLDFPLQTARAHTDLLRSTRLNFGPVSVQKTIEKRSENRYAVTLKVQAKADLENFLLEDLLPRGAELVLGQHTLTDDLFRAGETILQYEFVLTNPGESAVTDPQVSWEVK